MATQFYSRSAKAAWGFACNQSADGRLWAGKGYERPLASELGTDTAEAIQLALEKRRGDRSGRFWVNLAERIVTMQVGPSYENEVRQAQY